MMSTVQRVHTISAEDRATFIGRVRARLKELLRSARWLERQADIATGTISKIASGKGRTVLDGKKLRAIASVLAVSPENLVEQTGLSVLLLDCEDSQEVRALAVAEAALAQLRSESAELQKGYANLLEQNNRTSGELSKLQAEKVRALACIAAIRQKNAEQRSQLEELTSQRDAAMRATDSMRNEADEARAAAAANYQAKRLQEELDIASGHLDKYGKICRVQEGWRTRALELERQLNALQSPPAGAPEMPTTN